MTVIALPQSDRTIAKAWLRHGATLSILLALTLVIFQEAVSAAVKVWWVSPTYSHCFLIVPIVLWLVWEKRAALAATAPALFPQALLLTPLLGLMWWMGQLAAINEVQQYAIVGMMQVLIVAFLGLNIARLIWFPILYLVFLVPTGEYLIGPMQRFATHFVDVSLNLLNIAHYTEGTTFELTNGRFEIAEACAGLRFLIATVTLGVLFSYMMFRKFYKAVLFLIASVAVPLIGNGLRCVGIIVLAHLTNNQYGAGADHIVYGWGFNVAILLVLGILGSLFRDGAGETPDIRPQLPVPAKKLATIGVLAASLLSAGPTLAFWHDNYFTGSDLAALSDPFAVSGWQQVPPSPSWRPYFAGFDAQASAAIIPAAGTDVLATDLFLGYYARPRPGHSMTAHVNRFWDMEKWTLAGTSAVKAAFGGKQVAFQEWIVTSPVEKRMIWSTYWVDGQFTTSLLRVKLRQAGAALKGHEGQAVLVLSTQMEGAADEARGRLSRTLQALNQLPARLDDANRMAPAGGR
ncbi:MAG TPA: exosortase A [Rhizomicrobium sp.]|nr:exosortase A [Rhizomicrobium sp.]